jgi:hypothetical protein
VHLNVNKKWRSEVFIFDFTLFESIVQVLDFIWWLFLVYFRLLLKLVELVWGRGIKVLFVIVVFGKVEARGLVGWLLAAYRWELGFLGLAESGVLGLFGFLYGGLVGSCLLDERVRGSLEQRLALLLFWLGIFLGLAGYRWLWLLLLVMGDWLWSAIVQLFTGWRRRQPLSFLALWVLRWLGLRLSCLNFALWFSLRLRWRCSFISLNLLSHSLFSCRVLSRLVFLGLHAYIAHTISNRRIVDGHGARFQPHQSLNIPLDLGLLTF